MKLRLYGRRLVSTKVDLRSELHVSGSILRVTFLLGVERWDIGGYILKGIHKKFNLKKSEY